jgi:replicative DNA helicase
MVQTIEHARRRVRGESGRIPPHNLDAEQSLLGAMLLARDAIAAAVETCAADDFYKPAHGHIFDAVTTLYSRGEPADPVTVADELSRAGLLEAVGGLPALISLQADTPATTNAARYARIVEEHALLRRLIAVAGEIAEMGYSVPDDVTYAVDRAETLVFDVAERRVTDSLKPLQGLLVETLDRLERLFDRGEAITGVPTGYIDLDERLYGLQPSSLVIVGARPAMGKTSFALGIAAHAAVEARVPTLIFSLEMSHDELTQRLLVSEARVDAGRIRNGRLADADWPKISQAIARLGDAPLFIDDNPNLTVMEMRAKARRLKAREGGLGLIIVDYLQLMSGRVTAENRQIEVSSISRGLKILARELEVPVVALSQLSRNLEMRADKRPQLADLRESGCLPASTRLLRADSGHEVTLGELVLTQEQPLVWSLDDTSYKLVARRLVKAFPSGVKPVFRLRLASGYEVEATGNHRFRTVHGWRCLAQLQVGDHLAVPRALPDPVAPDSTGWGDDELVLLAHLLGGGVLGPRGVTYTTADPDSKLMVERTAHRLFAINAAARVHGNVWRLQLPPPYRLTRGRRHPLRNWLEPLGLWGPSVQDIGLPESILGLPAPEVALFLRHLWSTSGSITIERDGPQPKVRVRFSTTNRRLAESVRRALLRLDIRSRLSSPRKQGSRVRWTVQVVGIRDLVRFLEAVGCHGRPGEMVPECLRILADHNLDAHDDAVDAVPAAIVPVVRDALRRAGIPDQEAVKPLVRALRGDAAADRAGSPGFSRPDLSAIGAQTGDQHLRTLANADVCWDAIVEVTPIGEMATFDATVAGTHNFVANGVIAHNSLEQDADVVLFLYRDEMYNPDSPDRGSAEVIVAKHRNGPTGKCQLAFLDHHTRFANMARV